MSKIYKNYSLLEILKILWDFKISIVIILAISVSSSFILYNFQKSQIYFEAQVRIKTLDPRMKSEFFSFPVFKENLINELLSKGYDIRQESITLYSRSIDQFGNVSVNDKDSLEDQRQEFIKEIDLYLDALKDEYINELKIISNIIDSYKKQNDLKAQNARKIESFETAIKLMIELDDDISDKVLEKIMPIILSAISQSGLETSQSIATNSLTNKKLNLEITYQNFLSKIYSRKYINVSDLQNVREVKSSLKIYLILGIFLGLLLSTIYIIARMIIRDK